MAAKIKDGLFIGDAETSQSEIFINDNKISNLVNLSGREVHNVWASHGLVYLTYYWEDRPDFKLFSGHEDPMLTDIVEFIDVSIEHGISVLLFSRNGTGRCVVAACVYLMMKFHWGFEKTYDYVYSKKPDIDLNKGFIQQMFALDMKLLAARQKASAQRRGVENAFKIEANMTISDIAAMLPPVEAKRWNAWEPEYVTQNSDTAVIRGPFEEELPIASLEKRSGSFDDREHKADLGRDSKSDYKSSSATAKKRISNPANAKSAQLSSPGEWQQSLRDKEDELVLIYSFINSKNTISALPGPYYNAYDVPKQFRLRFNDVLFEEDYNMFPMEPTNPRFSGAYAPRGVLKGARRKYQLEQQRLQAQPKNTFQHSDTGSLHRTGSSVGFANNDIDTIASEQQDQKSNAVDEERRTKHRMDVRSDHGNAKQSQSSPAVLESIAPMYTHNQRNSLPDSAQSNNDMNGLQSSETGRNSNGRVGSRKKNDPAEMEPRGRAGETSLTAQHYYSPTTHVPSPLDNFTSAQQAKGQQQSNSNGSVTGGGSTWDEMSAVTVQSFQTHRSSDLYEFVGMAPSAPSHMSTSGSHSIPVAPSKDNSRRLSDGSNRTKGGSGEAYGNNGGLYGNDSVNDIESVEIDDGNGYASSRRSDDLEHKYGGTGDGTAPDTSDAALSAEERLRNLMADMQRHKQRNQQQREEVSGNRNQGDGKKPGSGRAANLIPVRGSRDIGLGLQSESTDSRDSPLRSISGSAPSLYDLATMQSTGEGAAINSSNSVRRPPVAATYATDRSRNNRKEPEDPLAAFELLQQQQDYSGLAANSSRGSGAVRARHDIMTNRAGSGSGQGISTSTSRTVPRPAWGSRGNSASSGGPQAQPRYASPTSAKRQQGSSSNVSVGSVGSNGSASVGVGTGATSGSRVYRHGSPSPNVRPGGGTASRTTGSAGLRDNQVPQQQRSSSRDYRNSTDGNSSNTSLGSGIMGSSNGRVPSSSRYQRSPSPMQQLERDNARDSATEKTGRGRSGSPFLRAGSGTGGNLGSSFRERSDSTDRGSTNTRQVGSSPLRASYSSNRERRDSSRDRGYSSTGSAGLSNRRFSTTTPQSQQHYDYGSRDADSVSSMNSARSSRVMRSSTPTKATWRF